MSIPGHNSFDFLNRVSIGGRVRTNRQESQSICDSWTVKGENLSKFEKKTSYFQNEIQNMTFFEHYNGH